MVRSTVGAMGLSSTPVVSAEVSIRRAVDQTPFAEVMVRAMRRSMAVFASPDGRDRAARSE